MSEGHQNLGKLMLSAGTDYLPYPWHYGHTVEQGKIIMLQPGSILYKTSVRTEY